MTDSNMYPDTKTWNRSVGCLFDCVYCRPSFQRQLKRVAHHIGCEKCYTYEPHDHQNRTTIPSSPIVFVYGTGDIRFYDPSSVRNTFKIIDKHKPRMKKTYYFQSKNPKCFNQYLDWFRVNQDKVILLTTLETNRSLNYREISKAPYPIIRFKNFYNLDYPRKVVTIEPVLDFDILEFSEWIIRLHKQGTLEYVWFGFDSKNCGLPEPTIEKAQTFINILVREGVEVRGKTLREITLPLPSNPTPACPECDSDDIRIVYKDDEATEIDFYDCLLCRTIWKPRFDGKECDELGESCYGCPVDCNYAKLETMIITQNPDEPKMSINMIKCPVCGEWYHMSFGHTCKSSGVDSDE